MRTRCGYCRPSPGIVTGLAIIVIGVVLLLDRTGIVDAERVFHYWPLGLLALGIAKLSQPGGGGRMWGALLTFAGVVLSLNALGYARVRFEDPGRSC